MEENKPADVDELIASAIYRVREVVRMHQMIIDAPLARHSTETIDNARIRMGHAQREVDALNLLLSQRDRYRAALIEIAEDRVSMASCKWAANQALNPLEKPT